MIKDEDYIKAKQIVQEYEKQLNISGVMVELPTAIEIYNQAKECNNSMWFVKWFRKRFGGN